jgi:hypothetical protein
LGIAAVAIAGAAGLLIASQRRATDRTELKIVASDLHTSAAEARLLVQEHRGGRLPPRYWSSHLAMLRDQVRDEQASLDSARARPGLEAALADTRALARDLSAAAEALAAGADNATLSRAEAELDGLARRLDDLVERLERMSD